MFEQKKDCCGCGACSVVCPHDAIEMEADADGFLYPRVDAERCVDCGACRLTCPMAERDHFKELEIPKFYAAIHNSDDVLMRSSSGGAFTAISDFALRRGGVVYGAVFDDQFSVVHRRADTELARDRFCGSKYVQSRTAEAYESALDDLKSNRLVLFSGTPCQTAGIRALARGNANLIACDVICHSIPSPLVWEEYKNRLERDGGGRLTRVGFRSKSIPWSRENSKKTFSYETTESGGPIIDNRIYELFFGTIAIMRRSCYSCPFTDVRRASDITIADYWGVEKYDQELYDPRGVSLILTNSERGNEILREIGADMRITERSPEEELKEQPRLSRPAIMPYDYDEFWRDLHERGFDYVLKKYL